MSVERIADHRGGAAPRLGDLAEVFLGMNVQRTTERQGRAHGIGAAAVLMPNGAGNDVMRRPSTMNTSPIRNDDVA